MTVFSRYGRYKLPSEYKKVYDAVTGAIEKREIQVQVEAIPREAIRLIWQALEIDNPQFYYVKFDSWSALRSDTSCTLLIEYTIPLEEQHMLDQKLAAICSFLKRKAVGKNQKETAQILHDWLVYQRKYGQYEGKTETAYNILGPLIYGEAVCEGYAKAYKYLCDALKLRCMVVHGTAKSSVNGKEEGHAWNVVRVDGNFYHVDVTFDLCIENEYISRFYFLLSDKECMFDHSAGGSLIPPSGLSDKRQYTEYSKWNRCTDTVSGKRISSGSCIFGSTTFQKIFRRKNEVYDRKSQDRKKQGLFSSSGLLQLQSI